MKWRLVGAGLALALLVWALQQFDLAQRIPAVLAWIRGRGAAGLAAFLGLYVLACLLFLPGSVLTLGAGAVFGVALGFPLVSLASTLGATASFLVGRFLARDWVAARAARNPRFAALDAAIGREGWKIVALLRLSPVVPFNLLNYALGLTRVGLRSYILASWIGMMPGTLLYVWLGALAGDVAQLARGQRERNPVEWAMFGVGLLATVAVTIYTSKLARLALKEALPDAPGSPSKT
jgi:uncharacterized membrane protein YdjX (TVP38/TMEM64 family)